MSSNLDDSTATSGIIVVSLDKTPPEDLIQKILKVKTLPSPVIYKSITGYKWKIDNKYYSTEVNVYSIPDKVEFDPDFCQTVEAIIFYFGTKEAPSVESITSWMPTLANIPSEVQLLVCESCDRKDSHKNILEWCLKNQYELIELNATAENEDEADDDLSPKLDGIGRVVEALEAHTWQNLHLKNGVNPILKDFENDDDNDAYAKGVEEAFKSDENVNEKSSASSKKEDTAKTNAKKEESQLEDQWVQREFGQDEAGASLESLFASFALMREKASKMSGEERRNYAAQIAIDFFRATGGEEDEVEGFSEEIKELGDEIDNLGDTVENRDLEAIWDRHSKKD